MIDLISRPVRDNSFSTFAKFSEKRTCAYQTYVCVSRCKKYDIFFEAYQIFLVTPKTSRYCNTHKQPPGGVL